MTVTPGQSGSAEEAGRWTPRPGGGFDDGSRLDVRRAQPQDAAAVARVHVETWQDAYRGLVPDAYLAALDPAQRAAAWQQRLAASHASPTATVADGPQQWVAVALREFEEPAICGFVSLCPWRLEDGPEPPESGALLTPGTERDALAGQGELAAIYVHPAWQGRGVGHALMTTAERELRTSFGKAGLWVLEGNSVARAFYERHGWRPDGVRKIAEIGGAQLPEVRYVRELREPADGPDAGVGHA